ncbi:MAG TPA: flavodoxin [Candidatus Lokiarchaeia archaeon]|nr:flavodoxin [Candidatus Lokiarchaeia archaeon]
MYYSRSGTTKKVAETIASKLGCEIEELVDTQKRKGIIGFLKSGRQAIKGTLTTLQPIKNDVSQFDMVVLGTPVWGGHMSVPILTFITQNKENLPDIALFMTAGGTGNEENISSAVEMLSGKKIKATLNLSASQVKKDQFMEKLQAFVDAIKG